MRFLPHLALVPALLLCAIAGGCPILAQPAAAQPAPAAPAAARLASSGWQPGRVAPQAGKPGYCFVEGEFDNGLALVIARTQDGRLNMALGLGSGTLQVGRTLQLTLRLDEDAPRAAEASAVAPDMAIVTLGADEAWFQRLRAGRVLAIEGLERPARFALEGSDRALQHVQDCSRSADMRLPSPAELAQADEGQEPPPPAIAPPPAPRPPPDNLPIMKLPDTLAGILIAAGMANAVPLDLSALPQERRPADYAWKFGRVLGGVKESRVPSDALLGNLTGAYIGELRARCTGSFEEQLGEVDDRGPLQLRQGSARCTGSPATPGGVAAPTVTVSLLFYMTDAGDYAIFFHEAAPTERPIAEEATRRIASVLRAMAERAKRDGKAAPEAPPTP